MEGDATNYQRAAERVMTRRLTAVLSQGLSRHPEKRALEEDLLAGLRNEGRLDVVVVPNLYDLKTDGPAGAELRQIDGDMIVLSWMYPRGSHWILDFHGIDGQVGETRLADSTSQGEESTGEGEDSAPDDDQDEKDRVIASRPLRDRRIYCLDLRANSSAAAYLDEIRRIIDVTDAGERAEASTAPSADVVEHLGVKEIHDPVGRRWYPVIDFSRCTNCMECVDFCLFGVYGIDDAETILVELPDNCRKGCPACSRVCPEQAIIFPQHKTPAIAGAAVENRGMKIDLSKLFGAPTDASSSASQAERERDKQLQQSGRGPTGSDETSPVDDREKRPPQSRDALDDLIDELEDVDL